MKTELNSEKHAMEVYTRNIFYDVQDDIYASLMHCYSIGSTVIDGSYKFKICDFDEENPNRIALNHMPHDLHMCIR